MRVLFYLFIRVKKEGLNEKYFQKHFFISRILFIFAFEIVL